MAGALRRLKVVGPKIIAPAHGALHGDISIPVGIYERRSSWKPLRKVLATVGSRFGLDISPYKGLHSMSSD